MESIDDERIQQLLNTLQIQKNECFTWEELENFTKVLKKIQQDGIFYSFKEFSKIFSPLFGENLENSRELTTDNYRRISECLEELLNAGKNLSKTERSSFGKCFKSLILILSDSLKIESSFKSLIRKADFLIEDQSISSIPAENTQNPEILDRETFFLDPSVDLNDFDLDIFSLQETFSPRQILFLFSLQSFTHWDLFALVPKEVFKSFMNQVTEGYKEIPYHNALHAADVLQASHFFLSSTSLFTRSGMTNLHILALLFSAIIHDFKHPGLNNSFLVRSQDKLALRYNDESVLENFHLSESFKILKVRELDVFRKFSKHDKEFLRKTVIQLVLSTDMAKHQRHLHEVQRKLMRNNDLTEEKLMILTCFLHLADLSNTLRTFQVCEEWGRRVTQEFFLQGDKERELGLEVSSFCDKFTVNIAKNQSFFISSVMIPFIVPICREVPELKFLYTNAKKNIENWEKSSENSIQLNH